jgi:ATP diphosphatase
MAKNPEKKGLEELLSVMVSLRDPETGCPWDSKQDFDSVVPYTLEECYELADAIEAKDFAHVEEELGDVLFQVVFYAQLASEAQLFVFYDVLDKLVEKLISRHPHVFNTGDKYAAIDEQQVKQNWEELKQRERANKTWHGLLDDVPIALPSLLRAEKLQKRAASVQFDWQNSDGPMDKITEELAELKESIAEGDTDAIEMEMGDLLFSCVNLARHVGVKSENSSLQDASVDEMEKLWHQAKHSELLKS